MQLSLLFGVLLEAAVYAAPILAPLSADTVNPPKNLTMEYLATALNVTDFDPHLVSINYGIPRMPKICRRKHENRLHHYYGPQQLYYRELLCKKYWDAEDAKTLAKSGKRDIVDMKGNTAVEDSVATMTTATAEDTDLDPIALVKFPRMPKICKYKYSNRLNYRPKNLYNRFRLCKPYWDAEKSVKSRKEEKGDVSARRNGVIMKRTNYWNRFWHWLFHLRPLFTEEQIRG
ncbi:MAG: hypothetical protein Q9187_007611 [Circinaria calcarea]